MLFFVLIRDWEGNQNGASGMASFIANKEIMQISILLEKIRYFSQMIPPQVNNFLIQNQK
jgi:hypothetical protein